MIKLSKRMEAVISLVPENTVVWDIGCDHAYVPIQLMLKGICKRAIATDINPGPLEIAKSNIRSYNLENKITVVLSNGMGDASVLKAIGFEPKEESYCLIAAGMGGELTVNILERGRETLKGISFLILQPQSHIENVRAYLEKEGYIIIREDLVFEDGKYYPMMLAERKNDKPGPEQDILPVKETDRAKLKKAALCYGGLLIKEKHPLLTPYLLWQNKIIDDIILKITAGSQDEGPNKRLDDLRSEKELIEFVLGLIR